MVEENELLATLKQFTGCDQLARLTRTVLLTEGSRYLAEAAECFWLFDVYASHLSGVDSSKDWFTCLKLTRTNRSASVSIEDVNARVLAKQKIEHTDFPLSAITLYGCWTGEFWVLMLPRGCKKFCVNGLLAGNCRLAWSNDDRRTETPTHRTDRRTASGLQEA